MRPFEERDEEQVLGLLEASFGRWPPADSALAAREFFGWKHRESPFGPSRPLVAVVEGAVAGFYAQMPWLLGSERGVVRCARSVDLAVHPRLRRRGVAGALLAVAPSYRPADARLTWANPNELGYPRAVTAGAGAVGRVPAYTLVHVPLRLRRRLPGRWSANDAEPEVDAPTVAEALEGGLDVRELGAPSGSRLSTIKDRGFLAWRYGRLGGYHLVTVGAPQAPRAIAVLRQRRYARFTVTHVCELMTAPADHAAARAAIRAVRNAAPSQSVAAAFPSARAAAACGFMRSSGGAELVVRDVDPRVVPRPTARGAWALSLGDLELV